MDPVHPSSPAQSPSPSPSPPPPPVLWPRASSEEELYDCLDYHYLRDFPAGGAGHSKGRTRRERELRTNWPVPGGHERKITQKLLNCQRKRRQRKLLPRPRTRLACAYGPLLIRVQGSPVSAAGHVGWSPTTRPGQSLPFLRGSRVSES